MIQNLLRLAPDLVFLYSLSERRLSYVNSRLRDMLGYSFEELTALGDELASLLLEIPADFQAQWHKLVQVETSDEEVIESEIRVRHRDGTVRLLRLRCTLSARDDDGRASEVLGIAEDVTAERQAEAERQQAAMLAQRIIDLSPDAVGIYHLRTEQVRYIGRSFWETLGYSEAEAQTDGLRLDDFFWTPEEAADSRAQIGTLATLPEGHIYSRKISLRHRSGETRYVLVRGMVFSRHPDGSPLELILFYQDVTDQEKATQNIQVQRNLLREAERSFRYGSWEWDCDQPCVRWSEGMFDLYNLNSAQFPEGYVSGDFFQTLIPPVDWERIKSAIQVAVTTGQSYQLEHGFEDRLLGTYRRMLVRGKVIHDAAGGPLKVIGTTADITLLHAYEAELARRIDELDAANSSLRRSEALLQQTERLLNYGSWDLDVVHDSLYWSVGHYFLFGYHDPATFPSRLSLASLEPHFVHPEERDMCYAAIKQATETGEGFEYEYRIRGNDGVERTLQGRAIPEVDAGGRVVRLVGSSTDVTRLRDYETRIQEKMTALNRSNKELEQFAYVASHDLQEPLRKITAFGERLSTRLGTQLGADGTLYLDRMLDAAARMRGLINDLLNFSRLARPNEPFSSTNLNEVLDQVLSDLEIKIQEKSARIEAPALPTLDAIPSQMRQLFQNLLSNALKFARADVPPLIQIRAQPVRLSDRARFALDASRQYVTLVFQDNGIGFEAEFADRIFVLFQRLHGRSEYEGTGIGLAICRKIVDQHEGRILAESDPGQGARFTIVLPIQHLT
jgi:PAS domain S-box-containing protein